MTIYENNYKKLAKLLPELESGKLRDRKLTSEGFMDLGVDVLQSDPERYHIALSHYYRHPSGDMIADPDMEVLVHRSSRMAEALTFQDAMSYQRVYEDGISGKFNPRLKKELNTFLSMWLGNLLSQSHK